MVETAFFLTQRFARDVSHLAGRVLPSDVDQDKITKTFFKRLPTMLTLALGGRPSPINLVRHRSLLSIRLALDDLAAFERLWHTNPTPHRQPRPAKPSSLRENKMPDIRATGAEVAALTLGTEQSGVGSLKRFLGSTPNTKFLVCIQTQLLQYWKIPLWHARPLSRAAV